MFRRIDRRSGRNSDVKLGRRAFRHQQTVSAVLLGYLSALVFAVLPGAFVVQTPGWSRGC
ncbi:hypothetical protein [Cryobacterium sp. PH31-L1]|uniref:hypothetical protein n=1 Tax=Cryobacterium sp. PH31-L1 TaxID=3046199 RepID=UPI0024BB4D2A|nr:hypothetical protein [Cryobacterium sp. PH31-L1]MDJ0378921.1 hypothetical protein [Cryobacterium sp. PH31-L1]